MFRLFRIFLPFLFLEISGCDEDRAWIVDADAVADIGISKGFSRHTVGMGVHDVFRFGLWVPDIPANQRVPLVVALHYAGPVTPFRGDIFMKQLVHPAFQEYGAIIVAPDSPDETWVDRKSEEALISFIRIIMDEWPVDPERIIITGHSMGGISTWYFADKYPGLFYAAIPVASSPMGFLTGKVPHYVIQGEFDEEFGTTSVRRAVDIMKSKNRRAKLVVADSLFHGPAENYIPFLRESIPWINESSANKTPPQIKGDPND